MARRLMRLTASAAASDGWVRAAHFSPDTAGVDVYLTAFSGGTTTLWLSDVGYGDVSPYRRIASGEYAVSMRPHGVSAATPAALSWNVNVAAGDSYTAAAVGMSAQLKGVVFQDQLTPTTSGLVRVVQASSRAGTASIQSSDGTSIAKNVAFGTVTSYAPLPNGTVTVIATSDTNPSLTTQTQLAVTGDTINTLVLLDAKSAGMTLRTVVDAAGAGNVPSGSVPAGGGGTARRPHQSGWTLLGVGVLLSTGLILLMWRRRVHRPS
jgi:hypothetical protein